MKKRLAVIIAALAAAVFLVGFGGNDPSPEKVRADLEAAGCELLAPEPDCQQTAGRATSPPAP